MTDTPLARTARIAAGLLLVAVAAACSTGPDEAAVDAARSSANASLSSSVSASASAAHPPLPTAAELDAHIKRALDPALPDSERTDLIEDGETFRQAIPDMYKALQDHPRAVYGVTDPVFDNHDGTLTATMRLDKDGTGAAVRTTVMHFVLVADKWKISRTDLCGILRSADYRTPACG
ncbi:hypothetical protein OHB12_06305 [Nocardia sp. NBC_01730]|uniref:hypothetical protein n=1 Tax=Nocardia sp. NBC_01730 TaxID=2975998 RepID=UPI002E0DE53E|nr:hypothetical protein OHB12_06305 [Nocardia sp. NBC_01730]